MTANRKDGPKRVALYYRVSTDEQAKSGYSIPDQRRTLRDKANAEDWTVVEEIADNGYSGASPDRPGIRRVYELAEAGEVDAVLATKRDRFFRSRLYRLEMDRDLKDHGVTLVSLTDTGNRIGDGVMDDFAEWEREQTAERTRKGKLQKARAGKVVGGHARAYGHDWKRDADGKVVGYEVNGAEMVVLRRIFALVASGTGIRTVKSLLDEERVPTPGRGASWSRPFLRKTLLSDLYKPHTVDELREIGVSDEVASRLDGNIGHGVYRYEGIPVPVPDAGIPLETVLEARRRVEAHTRTPHRNTSRVWELRSILYCQECHRRMLTHSPHAAAGYFYYRCQCLQSGRNDPCMMREMVRADGIEPKVWDEVRRLVDDKELLLRESRESFGAKRAEIARFTVDAGKVERDLSKIEEARANYQRALGAGAMSPADLKARTAELDSERDLLWDQLERAGRREEELEELTRAQDALEERIEAGYDDLDSKTPEGRREIYEDLNLRVAVGLDKIPRISGAFPVRIPGFRPGRMVRTPEGRGYFVEPPEKEIFGTAETSSGPGGPSRPPSRPARSSPGRASRRPG